MAAPANTTGGTGIVLASIYTLSPLHCGSGQPDDVVDLPIFRERHTGYPVIPGTSIKGVARDALEKVDGKESTLVKNLFGPEGEKELEAGTVIFGEARMLLIAVPALHEPYVYITSREVLHNFQRDLRALGVTADFSLESELAALESEGVLIAASTVPKGGLGLDDGGYAPAKVKTSAAAKTLAIKLATLLPNTETDTQKRIEQRLVIVDTRDFSHYAKTATQVTARIKLNDNKTTGSGEHDGSGGGNLWYEEAVPPESLFVCFVRPRADSSLISKWPWGVSDTSWVTQIGGNETVGQGLCLWTTVVGFPKSQNGAKS
ncbi:MAG: type III-B CRISPR module RAMP protein Cmr4 [Myxococcales bacterium]|nr:type III-B CRISPR module RAMP protein Cmr4 [Myxococcales bacterium]